MVNGQSLHATLERVRLHMLRPGCMTSGAVLDGFICRRRQVPRRREARGVDFERRASIVLARMKVDQRIAALIPELRDLGSVSDRRRSFSWGSAYPVERGQWGRVIWGLLVGADEPRTRHVWCRWIILDVQTLPTGYPATPLRQSRFLGGGGRPALFGRGQGSELLGGRRRSAGGLTAGPTAGPTDPLVHPIRERLQLIG